MSAWKCKTCGHNYDGPQRTCPECSKAEHSFAAPTGLGRTDEVWDTPAGDTLPDPNPEELISFWNAMLLMSRHNKEVHKAVALWLGSEKAKKFKAALIAA